MKKPHLICACIVILAIVLIGCVKTPAPEEVNTKTVTSVTEPEKDPSPAPSEPEKKEENQNPLQGQPASSNPYDIYKDPLPHILEDLVDKNAVAPECYVTGNKWNLDPEDLKQIWRKNYPYMEVVFGPIADDFWEQGITYNMTDETLKWNYNEQRPEANRIDMGELRTQSDLRMASSCLVHETGHIWLQYKDEGVTFAHGQWIWEGHSVLFERIACAEEFDRENRTDEITCVNFDLLDYIGPEALNGLVSDGNMTNRSLADMPAAAALYYLDTVLSTPGTYDYWRTVSIERNKWCQENDLSFTKPEILSEIMDRVADGKTMDGMKPSEWLFSRAVANIDGKDGTYLLTYGSSPGRKYNPDGLAGKYCFGQDFRVSVYAFTRKDGKDSPLEGQTVNVKLFDAQGNERYEKDLVMGHDGGIEKAEVGPDGTFLTTDDFKEYSAIRILANAQIAGKEYSATNYMICINRDDEISSSDNRMFFILTNEDESINTTLTDVEVTGGYNVDKSHLQDGLLIVQVKQGEDVTVFGKTYSKPCGARVIPVRP